MGMSERKTVRITCAWCGKPDQMYQSQYDRRMLHAKSKKLFCSTSCSAKHHADLWQRLKAGHGTSI